MKDIGSFLNKLQHVKALEQNQWTADCPCPTHKTPAKHLAISLEDNKILVHCFGSDTAEDVVTAIGLTLSDLFIDDIKPTPKIAAEYDYTDESGNLLFQVVRYEPKSFSQRRKDSSGKWVWNLTATRRVLWKLPEILMCPDTIYFVEGEKDAQALWDYGQVATTSPGGSSAWKPEYANYLTGKRIVIIPDKDEAGYAYARDVIKSLQGKAREVKCIILPGDNVKDFSDWIIENDITELPLLEEDIAVLLNPDMPLYKTEEGHIVWRKNTSGQSLVFQAEMIRLERTGVHARISISLDYRKLAWSLLNIERSEERTRLSNLAYGSVQLQEYTKDNLRHDLDIFCAGLWDYHVSSFTPQLVEGEETNEPPCFYLYPYIIEGGGSILFAPPGKGKSTTALLWAQSINTGTSKIWKTQKAPTLYVNLERSAQSIKRRLADVNKALGLPAKQTLLILNARGKSLSNVAPAIRKTVEQCGVKVIIVDSMSRAGFGDLTENKPVNAIIDTLSELSPCWVALGHTPRASEDRIYGCHDAQTEILTAKGWIKFPDWKGQSVLTFRNDNGHSHFEYRKPLQFHKYDYSGEMLLINSRNASGCVTPNHRFWIWNKEGKKDWKIAKDLPAECRLPTARAIKNHCRIKDYIGYPIEDLAELAGIFISEGSYQKGLVYLTQAEKNASRIHNILQKLGLEYKVHRCLPKREKDKEIISQFYFRCNPQMRKFIKTECGVGAKNKRLPQNWKEWTLKAKKNLFDTLMWGDGHWCSKTYGVYTTISPQLANGFQLLAMTLGYKATIKKRNGVEHLQDSYAVQVLGGKGWSWLIKKHHIKSVEYSGKVYCFTMPTGFLVTRRDGRTLVSGNSVFFDAGADIVIQLRSQISNNGTMGVGFEITKANDLPRYGQEVFAFEYKDWGLSEVRQAKPYEFPDIEAKKKTDMLESVMDYIANQDTGDAHATDIEKALGFNRVNISKLLNQSGRFVKTRKVKQSQFFGVMTE